MKVEPMLHSLYIFSSVYAWARQTKMVLCVLEDETQSRSISLSKKR